MNTATEQRRSKIMELVRRDGSVRVMQISRLFSVSEVTVRNDLEYLESQGQLNRIHGGAVSTGKLYANMDLTERYLTNSSAKRELAPAAARLIKSNDTIMMNAGTTLKYLLRELQGKKNISIVTNSIQNALEVSSYPGINVILLGGEIDPKYHFTFGDDTVNQLKNYHADKAIISIDGISEENGLTLYYSNESGLVRKMLELSDQVIVVADSSKLGKSAFSRVASLNDVDIIVTNQKEEGEESKWLRELGVEVIEV